MLLNLGAMVQSTGSTGRYSTLDQDPEPPKTVWYPSSDFLWKQYPKGKPTNDNIKKEIIPLMNSILHDTYMMNSNQNPICFFQNHRTKQAYFMIIASFINICFRNLISISLHIKCTWVKNKVL